MNNSKFNSPLPIFLNIITSPVEAVDLILSRRRLCIYPLLLLIASFVILWISYYSHVDFEWLTNTMIADAQLKNPEIERKLLVDRMGGLTSNLMMSITLITGLITIMILIIIRAVYMLLTSRFFDSKKYGGSHWLAITIWSCVPMSLSTLASYLYFSAEEMRHSTHDALSLTSLNSLIFNFARNEPWAMFTSSIDLTLLWSFLIVAIAFKKMNEMGTFKSLTIAFLPFIIIFGAWAINIAI